MFIAFYSILIVVLLPVLNYVRAPEQWVEVTIDELHHGRWSRRVIHRSPGISAADNDRFGIQLVVFFTLQTFANFLNDIFPWLPAMDVEMQDGIHATQPWRYYDV